MSVKPIVASPDLLPKFTLKEFKSKFLPLVKKLAKKHKTQETPVPFYLATENKYPDGEGFFMVFGKMVKWKKFAKDNAPKQEALRGYCFVTENDKGAFVLNLMPVAGKLKAKETAIEKELKKVVSASKLDIDILKGDFEDNDELENAVENMEESPDEPEDEREETAPVSEPTSTTPEPQKAIATPQELANEMKVLSDDFKVLRDGDHDSEQLKAIYKRLLKWQKQFVTYPAPVQGKLAAHAEQIQKLVEATQQLLKIEHVLEQDIDKILALVTQLVQSPTDGLTAQIEAAIKSAEKLAKSLSADSLLEQIEEIKTILAA